MREAARRFAIAVLVAVLAAAALATTTRPVDATCPACDHEFTALELGSTNSFGGMDLDLCVHANGEPPDSYYVWVCPSCLYAEWEGDFAEPLSDDAKERMRGKLAVDFEMKQGISQRDIPGWVKYELLLQRRVLDEAPSHVLAWAALRGAWVVRLESGDALRALRRDEGELGTAWDAVAKAAWKRIDDLPSLRDDSRDRPRREVQVGEALVAETAEGDLADDEVVRRRLYPALLTRITRLTRRRERELCVGAARWGLSDPTSLRRLDLASPARSGRGVIQKRVTVTARAQRTSAIHAASRATS